MGRENRTSYKDSHICVFGTPYFLKTKKEKLRQAQLGLPHTEIQFIMVQEVVGKDKEQRYKTTGGGTLGSDVTLRS